jgi:predicted lipid carrier protein YhbT
MTVIDDISRRAILRAVPAGIARRFDPVAAGSLEAVLELRVTDADGSRGAQFAVIVADGRCLVERRAAPEAGARVSIPAGDAVRLLAGAARWQELLAQRRLTLAGDPFLALRFPTLFGFARSR